MIFFNILIPYENLKLAKNKSFNFYLFQFDIKSHTKWTKLGCLFTHIKWPRVLRNYFRVHQLTTSTKELFYSHYKRSWTLRLVPLVYLYFHRNKIWSDFPCGILQWITNTKGGEFWFFFIWIKKKENYKNIKSLWDSWKSSNKSKKQIWLWSENYKNMKMFWDF